MPTIVEYDEPRYVRALTDYDGSSDALHPCPEAALSFKRNEILELVVVNGDEHWWQARSIGFAPFDEYHSVDQSSDVKRRRIGIIPSELLHQKRRKQRESDSNSVRKGIKKNTAASRTLNEVYEGALYESVSLVSPNKKMIRSVVLIGASGVGRNELKRRLIMSNPERFSTTVPHTSRAPRAHEMQGVDYYFVKKDEMEHWIRLGRFLEFGEYRDNLYGTLADSVVSIIQQGRIPVLNPHPLALIDRIK
ncbi:unnamed protein product [Anisakis simplex]|uniref:SH3 domain protein n=1 Tax=Anisakis simplex TaxID=6269 RepID=A0A0M3JBB4_ANISI|nr:unnamed protein product [Anisakis simplex]